MHNIFFTQRDVTYDEAKQFAEENGRWYSIIATEHLSASV